MPIPRRIYVTGGPGAGKTTLAKRLADLTGSPTFELDSLLWTKNSSGERVAEQDRVEIVRDIATQRSWIADGVYVGWAQEIWQKADLVIFLDISLKLSLWRVFWRHVKAEIRRNNRHPGCRRLYRFMRVIIRDHRSDQVGNLDDTEDRILTFAKIAAKARQQEHKTLTIKGRFDIDEIVACIEHT